MEEIIRNAFYRDGTLVLELSGKRGLTVAVLEDVHVDDPSDLKGRTVNVRRESGRLVHAELSSR